MIVKFRKKSLEIKKLEALLRRLPLTHPKRQEIENELARRLAGFIGEQSLDYYLSFLPDQEYFILQNLRLTDNIYFFQIDFLILSPSFFLIIEAKNLSGTLLFDEPPDQLIQILKGWEKAYPDPRLQLKHQQFQLINWLRKNKCPCPTVPIESVVVITNPATIIKTTSGNPLNNVFHSANLLTKMASFKNLYQEEKFPTKDIRKLSKLLIKHHVPHNPDILQRFHISEQDLLTGIHCPNCSSLPMKRVPGKWLCPHCSYASKDAHIASLKDYALLLRPTITNQQFRNFLELSSVSVATKLLRAMKLTYSGTTYRLMKRLKVV